MKPIKILSVIIILLLLDRSSVFSQSVGIGEESFTPESSALLELKSTSKGLLVPRLTYSERLAISSPAQGLMVYQTDSLGDGEGFYYNTSTTATPNWVYISNKEKERSDYIIVKSVSDFPSPVCNVISLDENTTYEINGSVNLGNNSLSLAEGSNIMGLNRFEDQLIYTGTGDMITGTDKTFTIKTLTITSNNSGTKVFNVTGISNTMKIYDMNFENCYDIGSFDGGERLLFLNNLISNCNSGIECKGSLEHLFYNNNKSEDNPGPQLYIPSGTFEIIQIQNNYFDVNSGQTALNINSGISLEQGNISTNFFMGEGTYLSGIDPGNLYWIVQANSGLRDGEAYGFCKFWANSTVTSISAEYPTYYKVSGTNENSYGERFDYSSVDNRLEYIGLKPIEAKFMLNGNVEATSTTENILIAVVKNGTTVIEEVEIRTKEANEPYGMSLNGSVEMSTGDYLEIWVSNLTSTSNVRIVDFQFRVNK